MRRPSLCCCSREVLILVCTCRGAPLTNARSRHSHDAADAAEPHVGRTRDLVGLHNVARQWAILSKQGRGGAGDDDDDEDVLFDVDDSSVMTGAPAAPFEDPLQPPDDGGARAPRTPGHAAQRDDDGGSARAPRTPGHAAQRDDDHGRVAAATKPPASTRAQSLVAATRVAASSGGLCLHCSLLQYLQYVAYSLLTRQVQNAVLLRLPRPPPRKNTASSRTPPPAPAPPPPVMMMGSTPQRRNVAKPVVASRALHVVYGCMRDMHLTCVTLSVWCALTLPGFRVLVP